MAGFDPNAFVAKAKDAKGFDPDAFIQKAKAEPTRTDYSDLQNELSSFEKLGAGIGFGANNMGKSIAEAISHFPGLSGLKPDSAEWAQEKAAQKALLEDPKHSAHLGTWPLVGSVDPNWAKLGNFTGEMAATLPVGGFAGGGARLALAKLGAEAAPGLFGLALRAAPALAEGSAQGTVLGGPGNRTLGALVGGAFGGGGSAVADTLGSFVRGIVKPTAAARELMLENVPLSIGQMRPGGVLSKIEEAGMHSALGGPSIEAARQLPRDVVQRLAAMEGLAPGAELPAGKVRPGDFMAQLHADFNQAYAPIDATPVPASVKGMPTSKVVKEAFKQVVNDDSVLGSDATRSSVGRFLQNQATILDKAPIFDAAGNPVRVVAKPGGAVKALVPLTEAGMQPTAEWAGSPLAESTASLRGGAPKAAAIEAPGEGFHTAEPLRVIRSNIRTKLRSLNDNGVEGQATKDMLENAEALITDALEKRLGPEGAAKLRAIDGQYAGLRALDRAVNAAGDSELGFTGAQLSRASQQGLGDIAKAQGGGGRLRELGQLMRETIEAKSPRTGAIKQTLPLGLNHAAGPLGALMNGPTAKAILLGATAPQRAAVALGDLIGASLPNRTGLGAFLPGPNALVAPLEVHER